MSGASNRRTLTGLERTVLTAAAPVHHGRDGPHEAQGLPAGRALAVDVDDPAAPIPVDLPGGEPAERGVEDRLPDFETGGPRVGKSGRIEGADGAG